MRRPTNGDAWIVSTLQQTPSVSVSGIGGVFVYRNMIGQRMRCPYLSLMVLGERIRMLRTRRSLRLVGHDYTSPGAYFITLRAYPGDRPFGRTVADRIELSDAGRIVETCWCAIPDHFPFVHLDAFVIMPDHLHGILIIANRTTDIRPQGSRGPRRRSIGAIVGSFKSAASKQINELRGSPGAPIWHRNYFDVIVCDPAGLDRIRQYILDNARPNRHRVR